MSLRARCDDDPADEEDCWCPESPPDRVRNAALLLTALAPVVVAVLKHGPRVWTFFADKLREPPLPKPKRRPRKPRARKPPPPAGGA